MTMGLGGIILAAGESTRMGRDKALLPWPPTASAHGLQTSLSETLLSAAIRTLAHHCDMVIVVVGNNEGSLAPIIYASGSSLLRNPVPERGQFSSLQTGLQEVLNRGRDAAMITLVDRPPASERTLDALVRAFESREHGVWAVVPEFEGKHGHPIVVGREMIEAFLKAPESSNARQIEHQNQQSIAYLPVDDSRIVENLNTPEDYARLRVEEFS
jgi:molybdenum cofactor cytidylyltransferase